MNALMHEPADLPELVEKLQVESRQRCEAALMKAMEAIDVLEPGERRRVYWKLLRIATRLDWEADNAE